MENEKQDSLFSDLYVSPTLNDHLRETIKWCRFLGILGAILLGLFVLFAIAGGAETQTVASRLLPGGGTFDNTLQILFIGIYFIVFTGLVILLLRFTLFIRRGLDLRNQELFNKGLASLKLFYIIYSILGMLGIAATVLTMITINA